jgi:hypothetical protein
VTLYFLKVADRYFDRSMQINFKIGFTFGSSVAKPDDFSTQRSTPESSVKDAGMHLINRYRQDRGQHSFQICRAECRFHRLNIHRMPLVRPGLATSPFNGAASVRHSSRAYGAFRGFFCHECDSQIFLEPNIRVRL